LGSGRNLSFYLLVVGRQCILEEHLTNRHVIQGVLRQLLVKLGSIPWKIDFKLKHNVLKLGVPTMLVGVNVNHDLTQNVSAVGFAASYDRDFVRYFSDVRYQRQGTELIEDLGSLMKEAIETFKKINMCEPRQVIFFRDGD